ncbi:S1C family serine protease [Oceanobacillus alkalisoli]|uniref:S1C family serine protease n=1 Tax=Oceanobacillus alkalisoli TaxID=2925113 RepID=UPI001EE4CB5A|nr:trypsin-like peptidase domain-containing protein [Oceanobacillus alkalisoli]MCG5104356.1 S1C family serine protease [Oceanobacillus alkalisoli]
MKQKRYPAIFISIVFLLIGIFITFKLYSDWKDTELAINQPFVNHIAEKSENLDLKTIIHEAEKSVIQIEGHNEYSTITGSGFLYNSKGDIITNAHVIQDADAIYVRTSNARFYPAAVIGISEDTDIAVIRVPQLANRDPLPLSDELAEIGDEIIALGSPHGFQNTVTLGIISGTERDLDVDGYHYANAYQISASITHGNSGGPLIKRETGEIIGINSVGMDDGMFGFSIPINEVIDIAKKWSNEAVNEDLKFASITDIMSNINMEQGLQDANYLTEYFWDSIGIRDYISAYSLLGSTLQQSTSYADFRNQYIYIIDLRITDSESEVLDHNQIETTVEVDVMERDSNQDDEKEKTTSQQFEFIFAYENDQLKIVKITDTTD